MYVILYLSDWRFPVDISFVEKQLKFLSCYNAATIETDDAVIVAVKFDEIVASGFEMQAVDVLSHQISYFAAFDQLVDREVVFVRLPDRKVLVADVVTRPFETC